MKITVQQKGGFAGRSVSFGPVETSDLPTAAAAELEKRVRRLVSRAATRTEPIGADFVSYELEVVGKDLARQKYTVVDEGNPDDPDIADVQNILALMDGSGASGLEHKDCGRC